MIEHQITPKHTTRRADGSYFFDFGKHAFGILALEIESEISEEIVLAVGEVAIAGQLIREPGGARIYQQHSLTTKPGKHYYEMTMTHPGYSSGSMTVKREIAPFRYAEVANCNGNIRVWQLAFSAPFNDDAASFTCSNETLNQVWDFCKYTMKATSPFGVFVDGNRERQAYEGDAYINQLGYFCCNDTYQIAGDTIERLFDFPTWPAEWHLCLPMIVHDYLLYTGDKQAAANWYPKLKQKLLLELADEDNLLLCMDRQHDRYQFPGFRSDLKLRELVDWPPNERDDYDFGKHNLVPNCWHVAALRQTSWLATELGEDQEAAFYAARAEDVKTSINKLMLKEGVYVDNPDSGHTAIHSLLFPLAFAIAPQELRGTLMSLLRKRGMACSVFAAQFLLQAVYLSRDADYAIHLMTADTKRSWLNMLKQGATITMEAWDDSIKPNQDWNHAWGAAPANIIPRFLAGVRPVKAGFDRFTVDPQPGKLQHFEIKVPSRHGSINLQYAKEKYLLTVPAGTQAIYQDKLLPPGTHTLPAQA